jgi:hypothetical protein
MLRFKFVKALFVFTFLSILGGTQANAASWKTCASEHQYCSFNGTKKVRYGANGTYTYKVLTNGTKCSNSVFGDPLYGTVKNCAVLDEALVVGKGSNKCLDVEGVHTHNGANVHLWECHGRANQQWKFDGDFIISKQTGKCLDVEGAHTHNGANVHLWECHGRANQQWKFDGDFIISKQTGKCLDVYKAYSHNGTNIIMWPCHGGDNQRWKLK